MTVYTITDLGYGDAGKGSTVDFLCRQLYPVSNIVVRHNGGGQAGHNVVLSDGTSHEFSQFGAGTFTGAHTFLSRFMLVNPLDMTLEAKALESKVQEPITSVWQYMHVDPRAKIITPYHIAWNRLREKARHGQRHGSCGKGIGASMRQHLTAPHLTITVNDLLDSNGKVISKLEDLRIWLQHDIDWHSPAAGPDRDVLWDKELSSELAGQYLQWYHRAGVVMDGDEWLSNALVYNRNVIFEGAQGVLLDEWRGWHPHTTWSTTTDENALTLLRDADYDGPITRLGLTRAYMTRHGYGPFVTEDPELRYPEPHNATGPWQGAFRQGHLDLVSLRYAIDANNGIDGLVVNHLDVAEDWKVCETWDMWTHEATRIKLNPDKYNLERQGAITNQVAKWGNPIYNAVDTETLLDLLGDLAPIHIQGWGPTSADKQFVKESVNA